jgi:hypothetical protein
MSAQDLKTSIQRSIDDKVPVHIEVGENDEQLVTFKEFTVSELQATGSMINGDTVLVNLPRKEFEETGYPVVVVVR